MKRESEMGVARLEYCGEYHQGDEGFLCNCFVLFSFYGIRGFNSCLCIESCLGEFVRVHQRDKS